jgi:hypothetical protein
VRVSAIAACVTLGFVGASSANPLDSPGTVYIDGSPCNLPCQAYMAWSRKTLKENQTAAAGARNAPAGKAAGEASRKRVSKRVAPASVGASRQNKAGDVQAALAATAEPPPLPRPKPDIAPLSGETRPQAAVTAAPEPPSLPKPETETAPLKVETPEVSRQRTPREQVMAALAVAEQITNAETPNAIDGDANAAHSGDVGGLVALLISRPDVKSASALKGSNVALDAVQSGVEENIRVALAAAGATETRLSISDASPLDRLISGDVQAAVLKLVSPDAAEAFPDIKGFKVLRVPLSPR